MNVCRTAPGKVKWWYFGCIYVIILGEKSCTLCKRARPGCGRYGAWGVSGEIKRRWPRHTPGPVSLWSCPCHLHLIHHLVASQYYEVCKQNHTLTTRTDLLEFVCTGLGWTPKATSQLMMNGEEKNPLSPSSPPH